ncbi:hypothetical protein ACVIIV_004792 [Bradyrhizobium sp. USDA 4354]
MFVIEDESHAEWQGEFRTRQEAIAELQRRALIPWNEKPNAAPCTSWVTCGRRYELVEFDDSALPWRQLSRALILEISAAGVQWFTKEQS